MSQSTDGQLRASVTMDESMKVIYDPVLGCTKWEQALLRIIDTEEMQRLRHIKQLGTASLVFPGAVHTRFEHSLGVGHLAEQMALGLARRQPELQLGANEILMFKLAGLAHDLGHGPCSHLFDDWLERESRSGTTVSIPVHHERRSVCLLRTIVSRENVGIASRIVEDACELIHPSTHKLPKWYYQLVANKISQIDVDKMDYIQRDLHYTMGTKISLQRFLEYARVIGNDICFPHQMTSDVGLLFHMRHTLHIQVYHHSVVRACELMLVDFLRALDISRLVDASGFPKLTDRVFSEEYVELLLLRGEVTDEQATKAKEILDRIKHREFYTLLSEEQASESDSTTGNTGNDGADEGSVVYDHVRIGYSTHPLHLIKFYDRNGSCSSPLTSHLFPVDSLDHWIRRYSSKKVIAK